MTYLVFFTMYMFDKTSPPSRPFGALFSLFLILSLYLVPYAPIQTSLYASTPIYNTFCQTNQNMMSGEISPSIGLRICPEIPEIPPACLVFVLLMPPVPQRTHTHPPSPILTCLYPFTPQITCIHGVI